MSYAICFSLDQSKILSSGNGLRLDPVCDCVKNADDYFSKCHCYSDIRTSLFLTTREFQPLNIDKLA